MLNQLDAKTKMVPISPHAAASTAIIKTSRIRQMVAIAAWTSKTHMVTIPPDAAAPATAPDTTARLLILPLTGHYYPRKGLLVLSPKLRVTRLLMRLLILHSRAGWGAGAAPGGRAAGE